MVDAQTWLDSGIATIADPKTNLKKITRGAVADAVTEVRNPFNVTGSKLTGKLKFEGYKNLKEIYLAGNDISEVEIIDCPNLETINFSNNDNIKKLDVEKALVTGGNGAGNKIKNIHVNTSVGGGTGGFNELNLTNCKTLEILNINDLGFIKIVKGIKDFDDPIKEINMDGSQGFHITTTEELERLEAVEAVAEEILGGKVPTETDANGRVVIKADEAKNQLITKGSEKPDSPIQIELNAIKVELGLGIGATQQEIIAEIQKLKGPGYISKVSLMSDAKDSLTGLGISKADIDKGLSAASARDVEVSRNKLVSDRFNELQSKLHNAHYLNIGLGTLSAGILIILTWMILKDRKLLPSQEDEVVKE